MGDRSLLEATLVRGSARCAAGADARRREPRATSELARAQLRDAPDGERARPAGRTATPVPGSSSALLDLAARQPARARSPSSRATTTSTIEPVFRAHVPRAARLVDGPRQDRAARHPRDARRPGTATSSPDDAIAMPARVRRWYQVEAFHEKPSVELARDLQRRVGCGTRSSWCSACTACSRSLRGERRARRREPRGRRRCRRRATRAAARLELLDRLPGAGAAPAGRRAGRTRCWSDWGTPEAIERTLATLRIEPSGGTDRPSRHAAAGRGSLRRLRRRMMHPGEAPARAPRARRQVLLHETQGRGHRRGQAENKGRALAASATRTGPRVSSPRRRATAAKIRP